jgi:hypothetical protein
VFPAQERAAKGCVKASFAQCAARGSRHQPELLQASLRPIRAENCKHGESMSARWNARVSLLPLSFRSRRGYPSDRLWPGPAVPRWRERPSSDLGRSQRRRLPSPRRPFLCRCLPFPFPACRVAAAQHRKIRPWNASGVLPLTRPKRKVSTDTASMGWPLQAAFCSHLVHYHGTVRGHWRKLLDHGLFETRTIHHARASGCQQPHASCQSLISRCQALTAALPFNCSNRRDCGSAGKGQALRRRHRILLDLHSLHGGALFQGQYMMHPLDVGSRVLPPGSRQLLLHMISMPDDCLPRVLLSYAGGRQKEEG